MNKVKVGDRVQVYFYSCTRDVTDGMLIHGAGTVDRVDDDGFLYGQLDSGSPFGCPSIDVTAVKDAVREDFEDGTPFINPAVTNPKYQGVKQA